MINDIPKATMCASKKSNTKLIALKDLQTPSGHKPPYERNGNGKPIICCPSYAGASAVRKYGTKDAIRKIVTVIKVNV